jgi:hypothetical protein
LKVGAAGCNELALSFTTRGCKDSETASKSAEAHSQRRKKCGNAKGPAVDTYDRMQKFHVASYAFAQFRLELRPTDPAAPLARRNLNTTSSWSIGLTTASAKAVVRQISEC